MKALLVFLYVSMTMAALFGQKEIDLTSDESLSKIFNATEIEGLEAMVRFVDSIVLKSTNETSPNKASHHYFEVIAQTPENIAPFEEGESAPCEHQPDAHPVPNS